MPIRKIRGRAGDRGGRKHGEKLKPVTDWFSVSAAGTFSGNPLVLAAGNAMLDYLIGNPGIFAGLAKKGDRLRTGFNQWARKEEHPATMTGIGAMFQVHMMEPPINNPRDLLRQQPEAKHDLQYFLRLKEYSSPYLHCTFISTAHSDKHLEEVLVVLKDTVVATLQMHAQP